MCYSDYAMKLLFFSILLQFARSIAFGQADSTYKTLVSQAGLAHLQKDYKRAISLYEQAFALHTPDSLEAFKAAGVHALDSNEKAAIKLVDLCLNNGWTQADWLAFDPYFDYLRNAKGNNWKNLLTRAYNNEKGLEMTIAYPQLRKKIIQITLEDQKLRYKRAQATSDAEKQLLDKQIHVTDSLNLLEAKSIGERHGWPKYSQVGKDGAHNFWLLVQHADADILFQKRALHSLEKLLGTAEANSEHYAFLFDRVQCNLNYKQYYGTQVVWSGNGTASGFRAIAEEDKVDERRRRFGMSPLSIYALGYGFTYLPIPSFQAVENDSSDREFTIKQIDSARAAFSKGEYEDVDKYYFNASVVLSGMTNEEHLEAALIFAQITKTTGENKYKELCVDFLNLLYLRGYLSKELINKQAVLKIISENKRWKTIYQKIS